MDQEGLRTEAEKTTPLFGAYRRGGYDPEQVDSYVAEQQRRLESTEDRAAEAERRLAAAVGQLRELHRRVAVLESEGRSAQPPSLDTLGERVQRILTEAWEGAYALRQSVEQEVAELRERATTEAEEIVAEAEGRAQQIDEEIERRRKAYLARLEEDRSRAVAQVSYLHEQRRAALGELMRVKELIEATMSDAGARAAAAVSPVRQAHVTTSDSTTVREAEPATPALRPRVTAPRAVTARAAHVADHADEPTVAVHSLGTLVEETRADHEARGEEVVVRTVRALPTEDDAPAAGAATVFDFEEE